MAIGSSAAPAAKSRCGGVGQQDGPDRMGHDDEWQGVPASAGSYLSRLSSKGDRAGQPKMVIGRSDARNTPDDARAHCDTAWLLRVRSRKPSGPAVMTPHRKAGHMIAPDPAPTLLQSALETRGPSTHASWSPVWMDHRLQGCWRWIAPPLGAPLGRLSHKERCHDIEVTNRLKPTT